MTHRCTNFALNCIRAPIATAAMCVLAFSSLTGQEQARESMALDNTAAQWSFQFAYQANTDYWQDTLANGFVRPEGNKGFGQFRFVAPVPIGGGAAGGGVTILPRLTVRYSQNKDENGACRPPICSRWSFRSSGRPVAPASVPTW